MQGVSRGKLDLHDWIFFFTAEINKAQDIAKEEIDFVLSKARFWDCYASQLNERQTRMVNRVFAEGINGFEGDISNRKYEGICRCSRVTAYRDLAEMLKMGVLEQLPGGGRSTRYRIVMR